MRTPTTAVVVLLAVLAGCGGSDGSDTTAAEGTTTTVASSPTSDATTTTSTPPPPPDETTTTTTIELPPESSWLTVNAFAGLDFGTPVSEVLQALEPTLGPAVGSGGPACTGLGQLTYPDLALYVDDDRLVGWWYGGGLGLATPSGVQPNGTSADGLAGIYGELGLHIVTDAAGRGTFIYVLTTSGGPAYLAGEVSNRVVDSLYAGETCLGPDPIYTDPTELALAFCDDYFGGEPLSLIATLEAIDWIEANGERDRLPANTVAALDVSVSLQEGGDPSGCWLQGDVTLACVLFRTGADPIPEDIVILIQDRGLPDPVDDTRLGAWLVVGVDYASSILFSD